MKKLVCSHFFIGLLVSFMLVSCGQNEDLVSEDLVEFELAKEVDLSLPELYIPKIHKIENGIARVALEGIASLFTIHLTDENSKQCVEWIKSREKDLEPVEIRTIKGSDEIVFVRQASKKEIDNYSQQPFLSRTDDFDFRVYPRMSMPEVTDEGIWMILLTSGVELNKYYRDGCYANAHIIMRNILDSEEVNICGKAAVKGTMYIYAPPGCNVIWGYHIVPWFRVQNRPGGAIINKVHDPTLFTELGQTMDIIDWLACIESHDVWYQGTRFDGSVELKPGDYYNYSTSGAWLFDDFYQHTYQTLEKYKNKRGCDPVN